MSSKVKVILHGYLKDVCPDMEMTGHSVAEIVNGLCKQTKAFDILPGQQRHAMSVVGFDTKESLFAPLPANTKELHLVPSLIFGKGSFFQVLLGAVLIGVSFLIPPTAGITIGGIAGVGGHFFGYASIVFNIGASMLLGGLIQMLSPAPGMDTGGSSKNPDGSKYLGAGSNTVKIGTRIPLLFGRFMAFGHYISFDIDAIDVDV